jgi:hypothetical protein
LTSKDGLERITERPSNSRSTRIAQSRTRIKTIRMLFDDMRRGFVSDLSRRLRDAVSLENDGNAGSIKCRSVATDANAGSSRAASRSATKRKAPLSRVMINLKCQFRFLIRVVIYRDPCSAANRRWSANLASFFVPRQPRTVRKIACRTDSCLLRHNCRIF